MNQPESEATATCLHCGGPMKPASRRNLRKDFCRDACRVAHRDDRIRSAVAEAVAAVEEVRDSLDQGMARLSGALQLLAQATVKPRRRKPAAPVVPSPELVRAFGDLGVPATDPMVLTAAQVVDAARRERVAQGLASRLGIDLEPLPDMHQLPAVGGPDCLCLNAGRVNPYCPVHCPAQKD